jgi:aminoglycoside 6'-N-acetyltransferase I
MNSYIPYFEDGQVLETEPLNALYGALVEIAMKRGLQLTPAVKWNDGSVLEPQDFNQLLGDIVRVHEHVGKTPPVWSFERFHAGQVLSASLLNEIGSAVRALLKHPVLIRPARDADRDDWKQLRQALWPRAPGEHTRTIQRYFDLRLPEPVGVLLAFDKSEQAVGLIELSIRAYAEGCDTDHVAFVEGWYVQPSARREGVGTALIQAAESWARSQGCRELASDAEVDNVTSAAAHHAAGFTEAGIIRCFKKSL